MSKDEALLSEHERVFQLGQEAKAAMQRQLANWAGANIPPERIAVYVSGFARIDGVVGGPMMAEPKLEIGHNQDAIEDPHQRSLLDEAIKQFGRKAKRIREEQKTSFLSSSHSIQAGSIEDFVKGFNAMLSKSIQPLQWESQGRSR